MDGARLNLPVIWLDSGDTLIDESTEIYDEAGSVVRAEWIPGAQALLEYLEENEYTVILVADGRVRSFQNVYRYHRAEHYFSDWVISEIVGHEKPHPDMFGKALEASGLGEAAKRRIVMVGNNLKKDIAGANRFGVTSVWMDWSPRYFHAYEEPDWVPDHVIHSPEELILLLKSGL